MRKLMILAVGALPIAVLAAVAHFLQLSDENEAAFDAVLLGVFTGLGALWGFAAGVLRRSLLRAIVGLNAGALCGYLFFFLGNAGKDGPFRTIVALLACGALLGCVINFSRTGLRPACAGLFAGALAFGFMGCAAWGVATMIPESLFGWTVMCLVPFGGGMAIFIGLVGVEPQAASIATQTPAARLDRHDYERGSTAEAIAPIAVARSNSAADA